MTATGDAKVSITKRFVDSATQPGLYLDDKLPGFRLKVTESGAKVYLMYGKVKGQAAPVKITIGHHSDRMPDGTILTAEKARAEAEVIRGELRNGINRNELRREEARIRDEKAKAEAAELQLKQLTLRAAIEELQEKNQRESTRKGYRTLSNHLKDWLDKPLVEISKEAICERYAKLHRKSPSVAAGVMRMLRATFTTAQIKHSDTIPELGKPNPVRILNHTHKGWDTPSEREDYIEDEHLPAFYQAVISLDNDLIRDYLMVAILTGLRRSEICKLKWGENIDLRKRTITIQKEQTKNKQRHVLAMPDYLYELFLRRWESPLRHSVWVFPGNTPAGHFDDPTWTIEKLCRDANLKLFTSHSLRRTFGTAADTLGYNLHEVQRLLNHKGGSVTERHYIQAQAERTREPMRRVNERLLGLMQASTVEQSNVVPLAKSAR
jgi:integrase